MTDKLYDRLNKFAVDLLDYAEGHGCETLPSDDTSQVSEDSPGSALVSTSERVSVMKACMQWIALREKLTDTPEPEEAEEPEIVSFQRKLKSRRAGGR